MNALVRDLTLDEIAAVSGGITEIVVTAERTSSGGSSSAASGDSRDSEVASRQQQLQSQNRRAPYKEFVESGGGGGSSNTPDHNHDPKPGTPAAFGADYKKTGNVLMAAGAIIAIADGPLPFGDALGAPIAATGGAMWLIGEAID